MLGASAPLVCRQILLSDTPLVGKYGATKVGLWLKRLKSGEESDKVLGDNCKKKS